MKKTKSNSGFTLVELLAVIVILAIILVIAVPKVMSIIEDAKKGTLESTAKMIASQAEKQKVQNTVLGNTDAITCDSIAKLNDVDYEDCDVDFDGNTAIVTIKGSGKFAGLYVCNGTKTEATATEEECADNTGVAFIEDLLADEEALNNGLIVDDSGDANIRYVGSNPNNKVYFNCKDTHNGVSYGNEGYDYANACEIWRIIGIFNVKTNKSDTYGTKRIKIVRDVFTDADGNQLGMSWDSSVGGDNPINYGYGINEWSQADLKTMLNTYYLGTTNACTYCNDYKQETCSNDCSSNVTPLSSNAQNMIGQAVWSTRAMSWDQIEDGTASEIYNLEQTSELTEKECSATKSNGSANTYCNDTVDRTIEWEGKIGLIYPSDWGYASTNANCTDITNGYGGCYQNNWLYTSGQWYWTISPLAHSDNANYVWYVVDIAGYGSANTAYGVRAATYLKSDIEIIGGDGNTVPFKLK